MKRKLVSAATIAVIAASFSGKASASTYEVKSGDSLWYVASKYNTTIERIKELNQLSGDMIYPKQILKLDSSEASPSSKNQQSSSSQATTTYTVKAGDYLIKIANIHHITLGQLKSLNGLTSDIIYPGQVLKVSGNSSTPAPQQTNRQPSRGVKETTYTVTSGDTLEHIATRFGTTVHHLKQLNGLSSDLIIVGQRLRVNGQAKTNVANNQSTTNSSPPSSKGSSISGSLTDIAKQFIGTKYVWGGTTPSGFDCSGFIYYAFNQAGQNISRLSTDGYYNRSYYVNNPQPGDLIFFRNTYRKGISHMGIYLGNNQFIHASSSSGVTITSVNNSYWKSKFDGYKRFY